MKIRDMIHSGYIRVLRIATWLLLPSCVLFTVPDELIAVMAFARLRLVGLGMVTTESRGGTRRRVLAPQEHPMTFAKRGGGTQRHQPFQDDRITCDKDGLWWSRACHSSLLAEWLGVLIGPFGAQDP